MTGPAEVVPEGAFRVGAVVLPRWFAAWSAGGMLAIGEGLLIAFTPFLLVPVVGLFVGVAALFPIVMVALVSLSLAIRPAKGALAVVAGLLAVVAMGALAVTYLLNVVTLGDVLLAVHRGEIEFSLAPFRSVGIGWVLATAVFTAAFAMGRKSRLHVALLWAVACTACIPFGVFVAKIVTTAFRLPLTA